MTHQTRPWLGAVPWQTVIDTNQKLYKSIQEEGQREAVSHPMTQPNYEQAQMLWERARQRPMTLTEALQQCRQCHDLMPFTFNNSETFADVAVIMVDELLSRFTSIQAQILKNTLRHFVTNGIAKKELEKVLRHLDAHAGASRAAVAAPAAVPAVRPQAQAF